MDRRRSLVDLREQRGLTQEDVAKVLGVTAAAYSRKENGKRPLYAYELKWLADLFGVSLDDIDFFVKKLTESVSDQSTSVQVP